MKIFRTTILTFSLILISTFISAQEIIADLEYLSKSRIQF